MKETAEKLLKELEAEKETEFLRIAKKRAKEILQLLDEPNRLKRFEEHCQKCRKAAEAKKRKDPKWKEILTGGK